MTLFWTERQGKTQIGYCSTSSAAYTQGGGDLSFATGIVFLARMRITVPRGATINTAVLSMQVVAKNAGTAQTSYHTVRAHASGDSPLLTVGVAEALRPQTSASYAWVNVWPVNPPGDVIATLDVKNIVNEIISRSDYQPGGYITFMMTTTDENGSDMSVRANNDFARSWELEVDFTQNYVSDLQTSINIINNPHNAAIPEIDATALPYWGQNPYYGAMVDPANQGVIARDTSFTRLPGVATLRFTTGTPPDATQATKATGPYTTTPKQNELPYIFAGWIYIPSAITSVVRAGDPYLGNINVDIPQRDQWVPFCTTPTQLGTGRGVFWPAVRILGPFQAGWQFWVSEPTVMISSFRQMPFNGSTPDVVDPGGSVLVNYKQGASTQVAVREWLPRTGVIRNGTLYRVPRFEKRSDGILQVSEPIKGGPLVTGLPATAISSYPAGKTIAEL